jgi:hypothetical protein
MFSFLKSCPRWVQCGWLLPLVLLGLQNCIIPPYEYVEGGEEGEVFDGGLDPRSDAIMCDIPKVPFDGAAEASECASDEDIKNGYRFAYAAVALAQGENLRTIGLDYSPASTLACNGKPKKIAFQGPFPDGSPICLNCAQLIPSKYVDANAACVAKCIDLVNAGGVEPKDGAKSFCEANAKVSTNFDKGLCYPGKCSDGGTPNMPFDDPRRPQDPVAWTDLELDAELLDNAVGMKGGGTATGDFDSSVLSKQIITRGDAWIEFEARENLVSHVLGVSHDKNIDPDADLKLAEVEFALSLNYNDKVYVLEKGIPTQMPQYPDLWVGEYVDGERYRLKITDNEDGTATISYARVSLPCGDAMKCNETELAKSAGTIQYPIRVSALFREPGAALTNVKMVFIKDFQ